MISEPLTKDLQNVVADLRQVNPWVGLWRFSSLGLVFLSLVAIAWFMPNLPGFLAITAIAGIFYAFWLICTHDMVHYSLTGWTWFETVMPRLISWMMLWPYGLYAEIHRLHHGWNGVDLRDPERVQWTTAEYQQATPFLRWYVRHQWMMDIFVLGGIGLILKTFVQALRFQQRVPRIRWQLLWDVSGMLVIQGILVAIALHYGELVRYILFWLVLERVIGTIAQTRDHLEHYALWGKASNYQLTQLYACRNLKTSLMVGWLMGGLNYHAVHHAFPDIPFNQLPEAFHRIQHILQQQGLPPMTLGQGYIQETLYFMRHASIIGEANPQDLTRRDRMIPIN
jgi:fatty acid desaturase